MQRAEQPQQLVLLQPSQLHGQYFVGDGRRIMRRFANQSVRVIIGSSPYYDARNYGKDMDEIYGGWADCMHEWTEYEYKMHNGRGDAQKSGKYSEQADIKDAQLKYRMCIKCDAWKGQLGHEMTPEEFISHLCDYYDEAMRILHDTGALVNVIADTMDKKTKSWHGIPAMFELEMKRRGWICRAKLIWEKPNVKPENVDDRPAVNYETIFMFVKKAKTRFWVNKKLKLVAFKKRKDDIEGEDWYWKQKFLDNEDEEGQETPQPKKSWVHGPEIGRESGTWWAKKSYWVSYDYYYEQQYEPYADSTVLEALKKYIGKAVKDYEASAAENASNVKRRINQSTLESLLDLGVLDNIDLKELGTMPPVGGVKKAGGDNATYSGNRPDYKWGRIMRSVLSIQTARYKGAHFAAFPLELVEILLHMLCPPAVCRFCGLPKVRITSEVRINTRPGKDVNKEKSGTSDDPNRNFHRSILTKYRQAIIRAKHDEYAECSCTVSAFKEGDHVNIVAGTAALPNTTNTFVGKTPDEVYNTLAAEGKWAKPIVYDNWGGTGSTCVVADRMGLGWCYSDKNPEYCELAKKRMREDPWKPGQHDDATEKPVSQMGKDKDGHSYIPLDACFSNNGPVPQQRDTKEPTDPV